MLNVSLFALKQSLMSHLLQFLPTQSNSASTLLSATIQSDGFCSVQPSCGYITSYVAVAWRTIVPRSSVKIPFIADVPRSIPMKKLSFNFYPFCQYSPLDTLTYKSTPFTPYKSEHHFWGAYHFVSSSIHSFLSTAFPLLLGWIPSIRYCTALVSLNPVFSYKSNTSTLSYSAQIVLRF